MFKLLNLFIAVSLLTASIPVASVSARAAHAQPVLLQLALDEPDEIVRVIVQKSTMTEQIEALVAQLDGIVTQDLHIINAFVAELPAKSIPDLAVEQGVRWISLDAPVVRVNGVTQDTITLHEEFDDVSFNANFAGGTWPSAWTELSEADGPQMGNVRIARFHGGEMQGVRLSENNSGIQSEISLDNAATASLTVAYKRKGFGPGDNVQVGISADGGASWAELTRLTGTSDAEIVTETFDISSHASAETVVRFVTAFMPESQARFYIDSVELVPTLYNEDANSIVEQMYLPFVSAAQKNSSLNNDYIQAADVSNSEFVRDEFESITFDNNDGSVDWLGPWIELGEYNGPDSGDIRVTDMESGPENVLRIRDAHRGVERSVGLSDAASATLNLKYRRKNLDGDSDYVKIEVSTDRGNSWAEIGRIVGDDNDDTLQPASYDLSAYAGNTVTLRLLSSWSMNSYNKSRTDKIYIDDVEVVYTPFVQADISNNLQQSIANESLASDSSGKTSAISTTVPLKSTDEFTGTVAIVRDEFTNRAFDNNDGNVSWFGDWIEVDEQKSGPDGGAVNIQHGSLFLSKFWYEGEDPSITRSIAFPRDVLTATLSFNFGTSSRVDATDAIAIEISNDGGASYTEIGSIVGISGIVSDTVSIDISNHTSVNSMVRIRVAENYSAFWEFISIDNFQVAYTIADCTQCIDTDNLANRFVEIIGADKLWNEPDPIQGQNVGVAVVDTGIATHDDLLDDFGVSRILTQMQFNSISGFIDDYYGHGSHIAGIIGGNGSMSDGTYIGVAPEANLIDVKVVDDQGVGSTADVIAGLQWVLENKDVHNIRVVNLSLSSTISESYLTNPLNAAVEILWLKGIVVVVSAGNTGSGPIYSPANDPFVITVGAVDDNATVETSDDVLASYSTYGVTVDNIAKPDIVAPGTNIISLLSSDDSSLIFEHPAHRLLGIDGNDYFRMSGTSMASAVAAGAVALLLEDEPHLTPDQVKYRLMSTAAPMAGPEPGSTGAGYLDIYAAVNGTETGVANIGNRPHDLIAKMALIALWSSHNNGDQLDWDSVNWDSVNWDSVNWDSVNWDSVNWDSVNWDSVNWDSVNWDSVNWDSVNWDSVNWDSVNWDSVNWDSVKWHTFIWDD